MGSIGGKGKALAAARSKKMRCSTRRRSRPSTHRRPGVPGGAAEGAVVVFAGSWRRRDARGGGTDETSAPASHEARRVPTIERLTPAERKKGDERGTLATPAAATS